MSSFSRYLPTSVIHYGQKSPSSLIKPVSRNSDFIFQTEKTIEEKCQEGYNHWFDFSRILLPAHYCYEQDSQRTALEVGACPLEVGACPPLIPAVQMIQSPSCCTDLRKRSREIRDELENHLSDTDDKHPKGGKIKREENEEEGVDNSTKGKLILQLIRDKTKTAEDNDDKELFSSHGEENQDDHNETTHQSYYEKSKMTKTKLDEYLEKRRKNNASAKKSRDARRMRELQTQIHAAYLEDENSKLRTIVGALRKENNHLRDVLIVQLDAEKKTIKAANR